MDNSFNDRTRQILKFIVDDYIDTGEAVGSRSLVKKHNISLSPATIRNIMSDLEDIGFISHPHISAGRVPTKKGLQYYVDALLNFEVAEINDYKNFILKSLQGSELKLSEICSKISDVISGITNCVGIVMVPDIKTSSLNHIEFLRLNENKILLILVNEFGQIQNKLLDVNFNITQDELNVLTDYFNKKFTNMNILDIRDSIISEMESIKNIFNEKVSSLIKRFSDIKWEESPHKNDIIIKGLQNVIEGDYFKKDMDSLKKLIKIFEEKDNILTILDKSIDMPGIQIFVGSSNKYFENFSLVSSSYSKSGVSLGFLGVIGPLRMNYNKIVPIVNCAAQVVTTILDQNFRRSD